MCVRMVIVASAAMLLTGCTHPAVEQGGLPTSMGPTTYAAVPAGASGQTSPASASPPASVARLPVDTALPPDRNGNPACPPSDAWGKDPTESGILVTVWSDHAESVTVLVRSKNGVDRAQTELIEPQEHFRLFEFPDVDHAAVAEVLILTNTRRCYSTMDPATAAR